MLGDDPDTTVTTPRVGSGTIFGRAREEGRGLMRGVGMGLGGLWRAGWSERRWERCSPAGFSMTENVRCVTGYTAAIVIRWGVKRTPNAMKLGRRSTDNKTTPHDNFHPIPRTFFGHL